MISLARDQFTLLLSAATWLSADQRRTFEEIEKAAQETSLNTEPNSLLLNQADTAAILNTHRTTIWRLKQEGILCPVELLPGTYRYRREEVEALAKHGYLHLLRQRRKAV